MRYVGQTVDFETRIKHHFQELRGNRHYNSHLQRSFNKFGEDCFEVCILEDVSVEMLNNREIAWIRYYDSVKHGYNQESGGHKNKRLSPEHAAKIGNALRGKSKSQSHRANLSAARTGKASVKKHSPETILKMSQWRKNYYAARRIA